MNAWRFSKGACAPRTLRGAGFVLAVSGKAAGDMKPARPFSRWIGTLGLKPGLWAAGEQVHGRRILATGRPTAPRRVAGVDGVMTDRPGLALRVNVADCVPVFVLDPQRRAAAMLHAGWRGTIAGIATRGIREMKRLYGSRPKDLQVLIGPHIRACCYEVGPEVAAKFRSRPGSIVRRSGRLFLDLSKALRVETRRAGVPAARFSAAPYCTGHDGRFFSYRRDKTKKRMAAVVAIKP